jgi:LysM repeat protein
VQVAAITAPPTNPTVQRAAATPPVQASQQAKQSESKYYKVVKGDTAFSIAKRNNITIDQLSDWNDLTDNQIKVGQTLKIKE